MGNIFKNNEAVVHFGNDEQLTVFPKNSVWYKVGFDTNMVTFRSRYNDEVLFYENDITETTINEEIPENFVTEFNQIAYGGGGKPEITDYDLLAVYNVTSTTEPTSLSYYTALTSNISAMYIDNEQVEIGNAANFDKVGEHTVKYKLKDNTKIGNYAFYNVYQLISIEVGDSVTSIGNEAFASCDGLTSVTIGNGVTSIGVRAFQSCSSLTSVTIGSGVTSIGDAAFSSCDGLTEIVIPNSVTSIGYQAFQDCRSLTSVTFNAITAPEIGTQLFFNIAKNGTLIYPCNASGYDAIIAQLPTTWSLECFGEKPEIEYDVLAVYNVTSTTEPTKILGSHSFNRIMYVDNEAVTTTSAYTFSTTGEHTIKYKYLEGANKIIYYQNFVNCEQLVRITLNDGITLIGGDAFKGCKNLVSIDIPDSVTKIGNNAFYNCSGLTSVTSYSYATFNSSIFSSGLGKNGLYKYPCGVNISSLKSSSLLSTWTFECFEPDGIYEYDITTFVLTNSPERNEKLFDTTYTYFQDSIDKMYVDGVEITPTNEYVFAKAGTHVVKYSIKQNEGDYPYTISSYAFKNVIGLTSVIINDRITAIDNYAFFDCTSLTSVTIPDSVKYVGTNAFSHTSLQEFTFNDETIYGNAVLSGCSKLTNVVYNTTQVGANDCAYCYALSSVTLNNVTVIGNNAFKSCTGLTSIVLPETIDEINANAFYSCSNLTDIRCFSKSISCISTAFSTISPTGTFTYYCDAEIDDVISSLPESYTKVCVKEFFSDYDAIATFNVTDISQPVKIYDGTTNLTSVAIGDNEIGKVSTYNFGKTGEYTVKYKLTSTKQPSFKGCQMMTSLELLEGCDTIKYGALQNCDSLSALTLPSTITQIAGFAFNSQNNMRIIRCYATTAPIVENYSFYQVAKNGMLYYPCGSDYSSWLASGSYYLGSLNWSSDCFVPEGTSFYDISTIINVTSTTEPTQISADEITTQWFTSTPFRYFVDKMYVDWVEVEPATYHTFESEGAHVVGYTLLNKYEVPMAAFSGMTNLQHVELSDRIQFIAPNAFEATSNLQFINIPNSVTEISNGAFYGSSIQYAFIGSGCTRIAWNGMQNCKNLEVIIFKGMQAPSYEADTFIENPNLAVIGYICGNDPNSFTALATNIGVENVECISEQELEEFIDSL